MVGVAREVAALLGGELHLPEPTIRTVVDEEPVDVTIEDFDGCPRYIGRVFRDVAHRPVAPVAALAPPPRGHALDLERRRRHELRHARLGQPAACVRPHEARRWADRRPARAARRGAAHARRRRCAGSIPTTSLITDGEHAVALAAIMGGEESEVTDDDDRGAARGGELRAARDPRARRSGSRSAPPARTAGRRASTRTSRRPAAMLASRLLVDLAGARMTGHVGRPRRASRSGRSSASAPSGRSRVIGLDVPPDEQRDDPRAASASTSPTTGTSPCRPGARATSRARST